MVEAHAVAFVVVHDVDVIGVDLEAPDGHGVVDADVLRGRAGSRPAQQRGRLLAAARAEEPDEQVEALKTIAARGSMSAATRRPEARPLRNLENIAAGELARWVKMTTPNDRPHVIRLLETAAAILRDELEGAANDSHHASDTEARRLVGETPR